MIVVDATMTMAFELLWLYTGQGHLCPSITQKGPLFDQSLCASIGSSNPTLFIEIVKPQRKSIVTGVIYRPPNQNVDEFLTMTNELLSRISKENKVCYLMGDFNLNLMNHQSHSVTGEFLDALYSHMFIPLITRPTRITCHSATLIDNIFGNQFFDRSRSGLFFTDISDHLPIFSIHFDTSMSASNETVFVRVVNQVNTIKFLSHLERIDWSQYVTLDDPYNAYNSFFQTILYAFPS